jgi:hypothetical protein
MTHSIIQKLRDNKKEINDWFYSHIRDEDSDYITVENQYTTLRQKNIKNPDYLREDLLTIEVLKDSRIRTIVCIEFYPHTIVSIHNHDQISHFTFVDGVLKFHPVTKNIFYKTTHFTFETNLLAYMTYMGRKIMWEKDVFNEYDLLNEYHSAVNKGDTSVKFLYLDYYT